LADRETLPDGTLLEEVAYTPDGHLAVKVDGSGLGHRFVHDERRNVIEVANQSGAVRRFTYRDDLLTSITDYDGQVTRYSYDDKGALCEVTYPNGATYSFTHDERGRLTRVAGPQGELATYEYDFKHNLIRETDPKGEATSYTYNATGLPVSATDALGRTTRVTYDALGRRMQVDLPDRTSRKFVYDGESRLISSTNGNGETTWMVYKGINALQEVNLANGQCYRFKYNAYEKLLQVTNLMGDVHRYTRDLAGRVVKEETFDGRELNYGYTPGGQVEQITYPDGSSRRFEYSWTKFLLREFTHDTESEFLRDGVGRITQARITSHNETHVTTFERDEFGRVTAEIQQGKRIQYQRDIQGRVIQRTLPNGATTTYDFATDGSLDRLEHDGYRLELKRDKAGREVLRAGSGGAQIASGYDELDRLTVRAAGPLGEKTPTARRRYTYDQTGRVKEVQDARWGHSMYFYDPAGRLLESRQFRLMETFLHDPASSIVEYVTQSNDGDVAAISVFTRPSERVKAEYGKGGRLLKKREWSYEYDARGRRTAKVRTIGGVEERTTYDWDGRDKLRTIRKPDGTRLDYSYDVFGRRVSKTRSGGPLDGKRVEFLWDGEVLAWELDTERGPRAFVHEPGGFEPILQQQGGETYLCVNDHLGMPKELIDGEGRLAWAATHSAYGKVIATEGPAELEVEGGFVSGGEPSVESPFRLLGQVNDDDADLSWTRFRCCAFRATWTLRSGIADTVTGRRYGA
jgi:YD repeat-containing protein